MSMPTGIPYPVLFKDIDGVSFAGFRSAMLEAWRVYDYHRRRIGQKDCQKKYTMLMEEAYLRGELKIPEFYTHHYTATSADWFGAPKGDIEPYKAFKTDLMKWQAGAKPMEKIIMEDGGSGFLETISQVEEERSVMMDKGILMANGAENTQAPLETENGQ
jgi:capsid protein